MLLPHKATMPIDSVASLVDSLRDTGILDPAQMEEVAHALQARFANHHDLAEELVLRGWLTAYQAEQILLGRGPDLLLGSYLLLDCLGQGGMGHVFKARHRTMNRVVAVKVIRKERLADDNAIERFRREARAAARLVHPNIVYVYDFDRVNETHFLVMQFVAGTDLAKLVKANGPLPVNKARNYIRQVALALQHAHEHGLVHRDIKPSNLLLTTKGEEVKVLDFGLALFQHVSGMEETASELTFTGQVMGTPDYMAPEQALESHEVDIRADIYSLGCTFYYLLTGQPPFPGGPWRRKSYATSRPGLRRWRSCAPTYPRTLPRSCGG
jgi:serine/threonine protein kinase